LATWGVVRGDWNPNDGYQSAGLAHVNDYEGVVIAPGQTVTFTYGTMTAPNLPIGSSAGTDFSIQHAFYLSLSDPLNQILGGLTLGGTNLPNYDARQPIEFTLAENEQYSEPVFNQACVVLRSVPIILSPSDGSCAFPRVVPEPSILTLFGITLAGLGFARRRKLH
jgi:hypothetical protein